MPTEYTFPSATGQCEIYVKQWIPEHPPKAVVQLVHGMAEHIQRYNDFAAFLCSHDILVVGNDHAGHGKSLGPEKDLGYFGPSDGWSHLVDDLRTVYRNTKKDYPDIPYILFGHSMGSFLARTYAGRYGTDMNAFVFSGTAGKNPAVPIAKLIAKSEIKKNGEKAPSEKLNQLSFGAYNKAFEPNRTESDWLSRDDAQVDKYVADPLCGFTFSAKAFSDLFDGLSEISGKSWAERVPDLPILMISGECDPVGGKGAKGVRQVAELLKQTGHQVELHIYPGARHEVLNETNHQEVYQDVLTFIEKNLIEKK